jgi:CopG family nickel-responsive transcriptional regulator
MRRFTITINDDLDDAFAAQMQARGYSNRSEAIRDLIRHDMNQQQVQHHPVDPCVAILSYLYVPQERGLALRLIELAQENKHLVENCTATQANASQRLEIQTLRGRMAEVRAYAWSIISLPGVMQGDVQYRLVEGALRDEGFVPARDLRLARTPKKPSR